MNNPYAAISLLLGTTPKMVGGHEANYDFMTSTQRSISVLFKQPSFAHCFGVLTLFGLQIKGKRRASAHVSIVSSPPPARRSLAGCMLRGRALRRVRAGEALRRREHRRVAGGKENLPTNWFDSLKTGGQSWLDSFGFPFNTIQRGPRLSFWTFYLGEDHYSGNPWWVVWIDLDLDLKPWLLPRVNQITNGREAE